MTILVTGATGFVGSNIVRHLADLKETVVAHDLRPPDAAVERLLRDVRDRVRFVQGDLVDREPLAAAFAAHRPRAVIHAGVITSTPEMERAMPARIVEVNVAGTLNMLEAARQAGCGRFVYVSSSGVYGSLMPRGRLQETSPLDLQTLYSATKYSSELLVRRYRATFGMEAVAARLAAPYGPMERPTGARVLMSTIYHLAHAALEGRALVVRGARYGRDWTYVGDIARALAMLARARALPHDVYNVSSGRWAPLVEVIATLRRIAPAFRVRAARRGEPADITLTRRQVRAPLAIALLRRDTGYRPEYSLARGLAAYVAWLREMAAASISS